METKKLNLVIPLTRRDDSAPSAYVHVTPLSRETFEANFEIIGKAFSFVLYEFGAASGPRLAALAVRRIAASYDPPRTQQDDASLIAEIHRLSNYIAATDSAWTVSPLVDALQRKLLDAEEGSEVENMAMFFAICGAMQTKHDMAQMLEVLRRVWGTATTALLPTAFANSLPPLSKEASADEGRGPPADYISEECVSRQ